MQGAGNQLNRGDCFKRVLDHFFPGTCPNECHKSGDKCEDCPAIRSQDLIDSLEGFQIEEDMFAQFDNKTPSPSLLSVARTTDSSFTYDEEASNGYQQGLHDYHQEKRMRKEESESTREALVVRLNGEKEVSDLITP